MNEIDDVNKSRISDRDYVSEVVLEMTAAIERDPRDRRAYMMRGSHYLDGGNFEEAVRDLTIAIELEPLDAMAYNNRGVAYRRLLRPEEAIADLDRAIKLSPGYREAFNNRGMTRSDAYDYEAAVADFTRAIEIDPGYWFAYNHRAMARWALGDREGAAQDYERVAQLIGRRGWYQQRGLVRPLCGPDADTPEGSPCISRGPAGALPPQALKLRERFGHRDQVTLFAVDFHRPFKIATGLAIAALVGHHHAPVAKRLGVVGLYLDRPVEVLEREVEKVLVVVGQCPATVGKVQVRVNPKDDAEASHRLLVHACIEQADSLKVVEEDVNGRPFVLISGADRLLIAFDRAVQSRLSGGRGRLGRGG